MKCKRCRAQAKIQLRQHNANLCTNCFVFYFQRQVERSIQHEKMFSTEEPVLVAVSGGKDSLALWDVLVALGYQTTGLHLGLGIADYSRASTDKTVAFAAARGLRLITVDLQDRGLAVPTLARLGRRPACAACGLAKRHYFDLLASEHGFQVLATGHNLDDEAARLMGNVLRWHGDYLAKQRPVLEPNHERFARKVRPLFRLSEYETAVYAFVRGIDYEIDECPNSAGASQLVFKEALNRIEAAMPGSKLSFVQEFIRSAQPLFQRTELPPPNTCGRCRMPSYGDVCSFCHMTEQVQERMRGEELFKATEATRVAAS